MSQIGLPMLKKSSKDKIIDITSIPTFYINLQENKERKNRVERILKDNGFKNFERFPAIKAEGRSMGCSKSHVAVLDHIIKNNIYPALILEDDIEVFEFRKQVVCPSDADAMYLGFSRYGYNHNKEEPFPRSLKIKELGDEYHRVHNMLARHAIIHFNHKYSAAAIKAAEDFFKDPQKCVAGDIQVAKIHPEWKVYSQNIPVFYQNDNKTKGLTHHSINTCEYVEMDKV